MATAEVDLTDDPRDYARDARTRGPTPPSRRFHRRGWTIRRALLAADVLGLCAAFAISEGIYEQTASHLLSDFGSAAEYLMFAVSLPLWIVGAKIFGLYDSDEERADHSTADDLVRVFLLITVGVFLFTRLSFLIDSRNPNIAKVTVFWALAIVLISVARALARAAVRRTSSYRQPAIIVGAGEVGQLIARKILQHPEYGIELLGFVDDAPMNGTNGLGDLKILGGTTGLVSTVQALGVERIIFAFSSEGASDVIDEVRALRELDVQVDIVPRYYEVTGPRAAMHSVEGIPLVGLPPARLSPSSGFLKRAFDLGFALVGLIVSAPIFVLAGIAIKLDSHGPVFFRQTRMGVRGRPFRIFKFRTMVADAEALKDSLSHLNKHLDDGGDGRMFKIPGDPRTTRVGALLRRYSLDEIPQLLNVLRGEMSVVGPRPLILNEHRNVGSWADRRVHLKPGITGPWQVLGRTRIPFEDMLRLDYYYVTGWSLGEDLKIVARTLPAMFRSADSY